MQQLPVTTGYLKGRYIFTYNLTLHTFFMCSTILHPEGDIKPLTEKERRQRKLEKEQWRRYVFAELKLPLKGKHELEEIEERADGKPKPFQVNNGLRQYT